MDVRSLQLIPHPAAAGRWLAYLSALGCQFHIHSNSIAKHATLHYKMAYISSFKDDQTVETLEIVGYCNGASIIFNPETASNFQFSNDPALSSPETMMESTVLEFSNTPAVLNTEM